MTSEPLSAAMCASYGCTSPARTGRRMCAQHDHGNHVRLPQPDAARQRAGRKGGPASQAARRRREQPVATPAAEQATRLVRPAITKDEAPCCQAKVDSLGRPPIGYCGPDCVRRPR